MPTVKSACTACRKATAHELVHITGVELPAGISESYCVVCDSWKIVVTDELTAAPFFADTPKKPRGRRAT